MRNALILLAVIALLILVAGAVNNGVAFDIDYVAGTVQSVSLFWVAAVIAAVVFVVGLIAAWLAQRATVGSRRKLEAELQSTYERLREAESLAMRPVPAASAAADAGAEATIVAGEAVTVVAAGETPAVAGSGEATSVLEDATTVGAVEDVTVVDAGEAATIVAAGEGATVAGAEKAAGVAATEAGEATAITMVGEPADETGGGEAPPEPDDEAPRTGDADRDPGAFDGST